VHPTAASCRSPSSGSVGEASGTALNASAAIRSRQRAAAKLLQNDKECTHYPCSGNASENCEGNWRTQAYTLECAALPPPAPTTKTVWIPLGDWLLWNASRIIKGGTSGALLEHQTYELHEIPLFAKVGAVVPT
jgi:hypothetical protein